MVKVEFTIGGFLIKTEKVLEIGVSTSNTIYNYKTNILIPL